MIQNLLYSMYFLYMDRILFFILKIYKILKSILIFKKLPKTIIFRRHSIPNIIVIIISAYVNTYTNYEFGSFKGVSRVKKILEINIRTKIIFSKVSLLTNSFTLSINICYLVFGFSYSIYKNMLKF